jgi:hypothetical protein
MVMKLSLHIAVLMKLRFACEAMNKYQKWSAVRKVSYEFEEITISADGCLFEYSTFKK